MRTEVAVLPASQIHDFCKRSVGDSCHRQVTQTSQRISRLPLDGESKHPSLKVRRLKPPVWGCVPEAVSQAVAKNCRSGWYVPQTAIKTMLCEGGLLFFSLWYRLRKHCYWRRGGLSHSRDMASQKHQYFPGWWATQNRSLSSHTGICRFF